MADITITNESKESSLTWAEAVGIWDDASGTWASPERPITRESKNALTITNESKN